MSFKLPPDFPHEFPDENPGKRASLVAIVIWLALFNLAGFCLLKAFGVL